MILTIIAFLLSLLLAYALVPMLASLATRVGLVDHPDNNRKLHRNAIPMVGGLTLFVVAPIAAILVISLGVNFGEVFADLTRTISQWIPLDRIRADVQVRDKDLYQLIGMGIGSAVLLAVGLTDDRFGIRGRQTLSGR